MAKFLVQATYSAEGLRGLQREKASGRREAVTRTVEALGGKVESLYFSLGDYDVLLTIDVPDIVTGTALAVAVSASGLVRSRTTPLLSVEEVDRALSMAVEYRPPRA
ncbi:MAG: GYD domain-containing protein [Steroidobacteraceae bacterium]